MNDINWLMLVLHTVITFLLTLVIGVIGLPLLQKLKAQQYVRDEGPQSHQSKTGTPTMGGWFFILSTLIVSMASNYLLEGTPTSMWFYVAALVMYAIIGFIDDFMIVILKQNSGISAKLKLFLQCVMVILLLFIFSTHFDNAAINFVFFKWRVPFIIYILFSIFWFVGFSNATNVTDGLDGLLSSTACVAFAAFAIISLIMRSQGTAIFCFTIIGALLGFLVFNRHPAKVFMGDTGSLAIGALLAAISIELEMEILLLIIGLVFVIETASVIIQVGYFKFTKRKYGEGRRIFLMSPYHHHLELKGIKETLVVKRLLLLGIVMGVIGVILVVLVK